MNANPYRSSHPAILILEVLLTVALSIVFVVAMVLFLSGYFEAAAWMGAAIAVLAAIGFCSLASLKGRIGPVASVTNPQP